MKILFITGVYPIEQELKYKESCKGPFLQNAPNVFQWGVIKGLYENSADFYVLSAPFLPCYPIRYKDVSVEKTPLFYSNIIVGEVLPYTTFIGLKSISIETLLSRKIEEWIIKYSRNDEQLVVLTYTPISYFIKPVVKLKRKYSNLTLATIVTDLVDDMSNFASNKTFLKKITTRCEISKVKKLYSSIDKYILLTESMTEKIPESKDCHIVVEGLANVPEEIRTFDKIDRSILYTGTLEEYSGVKNLVDAFMMTKNPNNKLLICGSGSCAEYVTSKSILDSRIVYKGSMPRKDVLSLQKRVSVLVNPRQPLNAITKYSFPSKTIEYMASGTPMIGYKLQGIPQDYYDYMYVVADTTCESLKDKMELVLDMSDIDRNAFGSNAKEYIIGHKTAKQQVFKILKFLGGYENIN